MYTPEAGSPLRRGPVLLRCLLAQNSHHGGCMCRETRALLGVLLAATVVALVSARPYAGAWNDGSRLATVESLVERGTLAIDESAFVAVPQTASPYGPIEMSKGTLDKLLIDGHFY